MEFNALCLINVFLAILALGLYAVGSYRFFKNYRGYIWFLGLALLIDILTATLASLKITPTAQLPGTISVPWYSLLFKVHVVLSMIGFTGFILLFVYLLVIHPARYKHWIRKWQFWALLPIWMLGEGLALSNSIFKIIKGVRLFDFL